MSDGFLGKNLLVTAGLAGVAFTGYCIYFDYKRRNAPDYKQKIRENRRAKEGSPEGRRAVLSPSDQTGMQAFFLQEMQDGEDLMNRGEPEEGAKHLANALMMSGNPQSIFAILRQALNDDQYRMVLQQLPEAKKRLEVLFGTESAPETPGHSSAETDAASESPSLIENMRNYDGEVQHIEDLD